MLAQGRLDDIDECIRDIGEEFSSYIRETKLDDVPPDPRHTDFKITF